MAITFIGGDVVGANATTISTLTWPAGVAAGDCALLFWSFAVANPQTSDPTGFTLKETYDADSGGSRVRFYRKICVGGESGTIAGLVCAAANKHNAILAVYRGTHATEPVDNWARRDEGVAGQLHAFNPVVLGVANCAVVGYYAERATAGNTDITGPSGYTERFDSLAQSTGTGGTISELSDDGLGVSRSAGASVQPGNIFGTVSTQNAVTWAISIAPAGAAPPAGPNRYTAVGSTWVEIVAEHSAVGSTWP